jgi:hypothetical protein
MKAKAIILAMAIVVFSLPAISQQTVPQPTKTNCDQKVLKKIKRQMMLSNFTDYMEVGTSVKYLVTCYVNEKHEVELKNVEGYNGDLKEAIVNEFNDETINCPSETPGTYFSFYLTFKKYPA